MSATFAYVDIYSGHHAVRPDCSPETTCALFRLIGDNEWTVEEAATSLGLLERNGFLLINTPSAVEFTVFPATVPPAEAVECIVHTMIGTGEATDGALGRGQFYVPGGRFLVTLMDESYFECWLDRHDRWHVLHDDREAIDSDLVVAASLVLGD